MKKLFLISNFVLLVFAGCDCNNDDDAIVCTTQVVAGLNIMVQNAASQEFLSEGVTVTATDGDYQEELQFFDINNPVFVGAWEREGNYTLTVTKEGYLTNVISSIVVEADVCHVIPQSRTVALQAE